MLVRDLLAATLDHRAELARLGQGSVSTIAGLRRRARPVADGIGDVAINRITRSALDLYAARRVHAGIAPATVNKELSLLQLAFAWARGEGLAVSVDGVPRLKVEATEQRMIEKADAVAIMAKLPDHHRDAMRFMALTGVSPHELERIAPCDVVRGELRIGKRSGFPVKVAARRRVIPLNAKSCEIAHDFARGRAAEEPMFPRREATVKALAKAQLKTGGPRLTPKIMRSLFASTVAMQQPEHVLQALLGHAPGSTTTRRHYTRSSASTLRDATAALSF